MTQADMAVCVNVAIIWLMGVTIVILLIALVILSLALYLNIKNKRVGGIYSLNPVTNNIAQEDSIGQNLYNLNDGYDKDDGSTFSVNSAVMADINRQPEPLPTTRSDEAKIIPTKKPFGRMSPIIQRRQMDEICKEVLKRVQKSDSASFRDLNALLNMKNEEKVEPKPEFLNELDKKLLNRTPMDIKKELIRNSKLPIKEEEKSDENKDIKNEIKFNTKVDKTNSGKENIKESDTTIKKEKDNSKESSKDTTEYIYMNKTDDEVRPKVGNPIKIEVRKASADYFEDSSSETEYDTVPSPVRFRSSVNVGEEFDVDNIPVYDLPPRRSYEGQSNNVIHLDKDTQYLLPISTARTDSCYINAKGPKEAIDNFRRSASMENPRTNSTNNS